METQETTRIKVSKDKVGRLNHYLMTTEVSYGPFGKHKKIGIIPITWGGKRSLFGRGPTSVIRGYEGFSITDIPEGFTEDKPGTYLTYQGEPNHEVSKLIKELELEELLAH